MPIQETSKNQGIQVISRAADILRTLGEETGGLSLGQIATRVKLPRSTVQRIVRALSTEGFISTENGSGGIRLGPQIQSLAQAIVADRKDQLRPMMQKIASETGETVDLAVMDGGRMLFVDQVVGSQRLRTVSSIGETFPLTTTANGKAALACLDEAEAARRVIAELQEGKTKGQIATVLSEIEAIRNGALAADEDEHTDGISAMGFAILDPNGEIFAVSVPVPSSRFARVRDKLTEVLMRTRNAVAASSGTMV